MGKWELVTLGSLGANVPAAFATGPFGSAVSAKNFTASGVPMLRGSNLSEDVGIRLDDSDMVFVPEDLALRFRRSLVGPGDLIFTCWGTIGQLGIIDDRAHFARYLVSNKQMKLTPDRSRVVPMFLYYFLSQPHMVEAVRSRAIGSSVPGFNLGQLKNVQVRLPPLGVQTAIVGMLAALDDKIAANECVIRASSGLARAHWAGACELHETVPLSSLARFVNGRAYTKEATGTGRMVIRIAELNSGTGPSTVYNEIDVPEDNVARPGDLLFAWSGSLTVARWYRPEAIVNQHIFKVIPQGPHPRWLVHQALLDRIEYFRSIAADKATTMGHIQRRHLEEPVAVPPPQVSSAVDSLMQGLWDRCLAAEMENLVLEQTRDCLLPLLMSGNVRVRDAEKLVEEVV